MRTIALVILSMFSVSAIMAQDALRLKNTHGGLFSLGMRTTVSTFNHGSWKEVGTGAGGQFRLQLHDRVNTEWYADFMTTDLSGVASRQDAHIGWSVMFYPLPQVGFRQLMKPYVAMGHCFDYTRIYENANRTNEMERWSSAIQVGLGNHFNITDHFDITLKAQYMFHLGDHVHAHIHEGRMETHVHDGVSLEGHLLFTLSVNYKIADLW